MFAALFTGALRAGEFASYDTVYQGLSPAGGAGGGGAPGGPKMIVVTSICGEQMS